jgi:alginate O-acetyltransferase complex protein AlgI
MIALDGGRRAEVHCRMLFNSYDFIFLFLPACLILYGLAIERSATWAMGVLIAFSLIYYGWWNIAYLPLLTGLMLANYGIGIALLRNRSRALLIFGVALNLGTLAVFKYTDFAITTANAIFSANFSLLHIVLPLGISFFIFQKIAYLVDCFRNRAGALMASWNMRCSFRSSRS